MNKPIFPLDNTTGVYTYNYSPGADQVYGGIPAHKELIPGTWGMVAADADANGIVDFDDKTNSWMQEAGLSGYLPGDFNMDIYVNNQDKNDYWVENQDAQQQIPNGPGSTIKCFVPR